MGIHPHTLNRRLAGRSPFTVPELLQVAAALGVKPAALLADDAATAVVVNGALAAP